MVSYVSTCLQLYFKKDDDDIFGKHLCIGKWSGHTPQNEKNLIYWSKSNS
jgi:hypothetical protein